MEGFEEDGRKNALSDFSCTNLHLSDIAGVLVRFLNNELLSVGFHSWTFRSFSGTTTVQQMPLVVAWALSLGETEGMVLDCMEFDSGFFRHMGQNYQCLARAKDLDSVVIRNFSRNHIVVHQDVTDFHRTNGLW